MTGWNEDNFLEKIIQLLGRRSGTAPCPEAAAFLAASDGDTSGVLKKAMAEHASGCPDCGDLQQRMERFDAPMVADHDAEWIQTEKRLDNWLESFLASDAAVHHERDRVRASRLRLFWARLTGPNAFRQWRWALVPAMALALVIGSFMAGRVSVRRAPQVTAEVQRSPVTIIPPRTVVEQSASEKEPTGKSQGSLTAQIPPKPAQGGTIASSAPRRIGPPSTSPTAPAGWRPPNRDCGPCATDPQQSREDTDFVSTRAAASPPRRIGIGHAHLSIWARHPNRRNRSLGQTLPHLLKSFLRAIQRCRPNPEDFCRGPFGESGRA